MTSQITEVCLNELTALQQRIEDLEQEVALLREREHFYRTIVEQAPFGVSVISLDGRFVDSNPAFCTMTGYSVDELRQYTCADITHPADLLNEEPLIGELLAGRRKSYQIEKRYHCKNGRNIWTHVLSSAVQSQDRAPKYTFAIVENVTARRVAESDRDRLLDAAEAARAAAEVARRRLDDLIFQAPVAISVFRGPDHVYELTNQAYLRLIGKQEVKGKSIREALPELAGQGITELLDNVYSSGEAWVGQEQFARLDRSGTGELEDSWFNVSYQPTHDADGQVDGILHVALEVTGQVRSRREVERLNGELATSIEDRKRAEQERLMLQEQVIEAQHATLLELSTPLMPIADRVVAMPLVGTIDSARAQQIMQTLLDGISARKAAVAILDITGVKVVDTQVASVLLSVAQAARLLGAQVILTGISPEVAQSLVGLGTDLQGLITRSNLQSGIAYALRRVA